MKLTKLLFAFLLFGAVFTSCGDSVDCTESNYVDDLNLKIDVSNEAGVEYVVDPSDSDKCNAYKTALEELLSTLDDYKDCAAELDREEEHTQSTNSTQTSLDALDCM